MAKPKDMIPMAKGPRDISVRVTAADYDMIHKFAYRSGASVQQVMLLGAYRLITAVEKGEIMQGVLREFSTGIEPGQC